MIHLIINSLIPKMNRSKIIRMRAMRKELKITKLAVFFFLLSTLFNIDTVSAQGQIIIDEEGPTNDDQIILFHKGVYYLTGNIATRTIAVQINDVILDGNGYTIQGNRSPGSIGIELNDLQNVTIRNFRITNFDYGLSMKKSTNNFIYNNTFQDNNYAVAAEREGRDNKFYRNNFIDQTVTISSTNTWYGDSGGNFWSHIEKEDNFSGPYQSELGSDGFSDRPYYIDEYNIDNFPLMEQITLPDHKRIEDVVDPITSYELIILTRGKGTTEPSPGTYILEEDEMVAITSTPDKGWEFDRWLLYGSEFSVKSSITVTMSTDKRFEAVFSEKEKPIEIYILGPLLVLIALVAIWYLLRTMRTNKNSQTKEK